MNRRPVAGTPRTGARAASRSAKEPSLGQAFLIFFRRLIKSKSQPVNRILGITALGAVVVALVVLTVWSFTNKNAYAVYLGENLIGYVSNATEITNASLHSLAVEHLEKGLDAKVQVNETVTVELAHASRNKIVSISDITSDVSTKFTYKLAACAIHVEGAEAAVLKTEAEANAVRDRLMEPYKLPDVNYVDSSFVEDVAFITKLVDREELDTVEDTLVKLDKTTRVMEDYIVQPGDFLGTIAMRNNTTLEKICADNGITAATTIRPGEILKIDTVKPYLSVRTIEEIVRKESVPYQVRNVENPLEHKTFSRTVEEGKNGEQEVTVRITRVNGVQQGDEDVISTNITVPAEDRVVEVGTSESEPERH
ncbi:MAG: G5 domain-containing protein [Clostridiales bacterium]|nr:G5 domain-containing protein [Clostridiales bacterium]